jgi:hypothetical protein
LDGASGSPIGGVRAFLAAHAPFASGFSGQFKRMATFQTVVLIIGSVLILFGYFRLITDEKGNVNLNNYRFTGGLFLVIGGMVEGARDLFALDLSAKGISTLSIVVGAAVLFLGLSH